MTKKIPRGCVVSYGALGRCLSTRLSGIVIGNYMAQCSEPDSIPWWRVIGAQGDLLTFKRNPVLGAEQRSRLEAEGVQFDGERVLRSFFIDPELL